MARASVERGWARVSASAEHTLHLQPETGAHFAQILPSKMRDRPGCQVEAIVLRGFHVYIA